MEWRNVGLSRNRGFSQFHDVGLALLIARRGNSAAVLFIIATRYYLVRASLALEATVDTS